MLELRNIDKLYDGRVLLHGISFRIGESETICLLGPSGSGKSTLLRIVAGLEPSDAGQVLWDGMDLGSTPPHLRDFGLVFQDYALFPHLNLIDNVAFGLRMKNWPPDEIKARTVEVLQMVNLQGFERRNVTELSGGEQQRVALARALAPRPRLMMFDEPLGALDRALREDLLGELRAILHRTGLPAIYVTHDQQEAVSIADRILLLHEGEIVRDGSPAEVWKNPSSEWAAEFLGLGNVIPGQVIGRGRKIQTELGRFDVNCAHKHKIGDRVYLLVRPVAVTKGTRMSARVIDVVFQQDKFRALLENGLFLYLSIEPRIGKRITGHLAAECLG
jgi:spermidine/putrescine transport system ATP-binding protein